jgi:hypothetical protein
MFRAQIPCRHRYGLLFQQGFSGKPILSETAQLPLHANIDHLGLAQTITRRDPFALKRFSHLKDKEEIHRDVNDHFAVGEIFELDRPMSALGLISGGIREFSKKT